MLLPSPERRGDLHFYLAKGIPYSIRLGLAITLMAFGFTLQALGLGDPFLTGLPPICLGVLLLLGKGYSNRVTPGRSLGKWEPVTRAEVDRIFEINKREREWDEDWVDITSGHGCLGVGGILITAFVIYVFFSWSDSMIATVLVVDMLVVCLPFWVTGVRFILKNDKLIIKATMLREVEDAFLTMKREDEAFQYQMQGHRSETDNTLTPCDLKAMITFPAASLDFLGVQMQIAINNVQGKEYPYFYSVIVARKAFGGLQVEPEPSVKPTGLMALFKGETPSVLTIEPSSEDDVDITVIRQRTTKNSGYHTNSAAAIHIMTYALEQARNQLARA